MGINDIIAELESDSSFGERIYNLKLVRSDKANDRVCFIEYAEYEFGVPCRGPLRRTIGAGYISHCLSTLSESRIPIIIKEVYGCDGTTYKFTFFRGLNSSTYCWWNSAPASYKPIVEFGNTLLRQAGIRDNPILISDE